MKLIFISYINRSGSTFLANEFSKYNSILVCPEAEVLFYYFIQRKEPLHNQSRKLYKLLSEILTKDPKLKYWNLEISDFDDLGQYKNNFEIFFDILIKYKNKVKPESSVIIFKADTIAYYYNKIPNEFYKKNNMKFISIIRDGRASYASQRETIGARKKKPMNRNPVKAALLWKKWIAFFSNHEHESCFIIIRYEGLILNFQNNIIRLFSDLGLQEEGINKMKEGNLHERIPHDQISMHSNILKPPLHENIDKWKYLLPPSHIRIFEIMAGKELIKEKYDLMNPATNKLWTYLLYIYFWIIYLFQSNNLRKMIWKAVKILIIKIKYTFRADLCI